MSTRTKEEHVEELRVAHAEACYLGEKIRRTRMNVACPSYTRTRLLAIEEQLHQVRRDLAFTHDHLDQHGYCEASQATATVTPHPNPLPKGERGSEAA